MDKYIKEIQYLQDKEYKLFNDLNEITSPVNIISSDLKNISASGGKYLWAVNNQNNVFMYEKPNRNNWLSKGVGITRVSGGSDGKLWGVTDNGMLVYRNINGTDNWKNIENPENIKNNFKDVTNSGSEYVWMLEDNSSGNNIYRCKKPCNSLKQLEQINGRLYQISAGPDQVWGITSSNVIYKRNINDSKDIPWKWIDGKLKWISAENPTFVYGVSPGKNGWGINDVYRCKKPCNSGSGWTKVAGKLNQITSDNKNYYGLSWGRIYRQKIATTKEEQDIINEINRISSLRITLFKQLNNYYKNLTFDVSNSKINLENQIKLTNITEDKINIMKKKINNLIEDKNYKLRQVQINKYYSDKYYNYYKLSGIILIFCILFIILGLLSKNEILPSNIGKIIINILIVLLIFIIIYNLLNINSRNNMNFDEYDTKPMPNNKKIIPLPKSLTSTKKSVNGLNIGTCIGSSCCSTGTTYDNKINKCV